MSESWTHDSIVNLHLEGKPKWKKGNRKGKRKKKKKDKKKDKKKPRNYR